MTIRVAKKSALKEDIKYFLEERWDLEIEQLLFKIFTRDFLGVNSIHSMLGFNTQDHNGL